MFNKKIHKRLDSIRNNLDYATTNWNEKYWGLRSDFDRLIKALNMVRQETHKVEYVKKDGPEIS